MKKKRPETSELLERLYASIQKRHPSNPLSEMAKYKLQLAWTQQPEKLYKTVLNMEREELKAKSRKESFEVRTVEFQTGVDVLGFPIICRHNIRFKITFTDKPNRRIFNKKGSETRTSENYQFYGEIVKQH